MYGKKKKSSLTTTTTTSSAAQPSEFVFFLFLHKPEVDFRLFRHQHEWSEGCGSSLLQLKKSPWIMRSFLRQLSKICINVRKVVSEPISCLMSWVNSELHQQFQSKSHRPFKKPLQQVEKRPMLSPLQYMYCWKRHFNTFICMSWCCGDNRWRRILFTWRESASMLTRSPPESSRCDLDKSVWEPV